MNEIDRKSKYNPVPVERKQEIIQDAMVRIKDESLDAIAASHGISQPTLWKWLDAVPEYKPYRDQLYVDKLYTAVEKLAKTEEEIKDCERQATIVVTDDDGNETVVFNAQQAQFSLARARALTDLRDKVVRSAQWELQARVKDYQPKQEAAQSQGIQIIINRDSAPQVVSIDHDNRADLPLSVSSSPSE